MENRTRALRLFLCPAAGSSRRPGLGIDRVNDELKRNEAQAIAPTLLLSPYTPPPIANPEQIANFFVASFDAFVFSYCIFDVALILHKAREIGATDLLASPASLMISPRRLVQNRRRGIEIGADRRAQLAVVLEALLREHVASPRSLTHAAAQHGVTCSQIVPFLRGVCLTAAVAHPFAPQVAYVFEALQTYGVVSPQLYLDGDYVQRQRVLGQLLLCSAKEFGSATVLYTALQLIGQQHKAVASPYEVSRSTCYAIAKEDRRKLDWTLKTHGKPRDGFKTKQGWTHNTR